MGISTASGIAEQKHVRLSNSIDNLSMVSGSLNDLLHRITGPTPTEVNTKKEDGLASLENVLNSGADRIYKKQEEALQLIAAIEKLLFGQSPIDING